MARQRDAMDLAVDMVGITLLWMGCVTCLYFSLRLDPPDEPGTSGVVITEELRDEIQRETGLPESVVLTSEERYREERAEYWRWRNGLLALAVVLGSAVFAYALRVARSPQDAFFILTCGPVAYGWRLMRR